MATEIEIGYFVMKGETQSGPYSLETLNDFHRNGFLSREDLCWTQGMPGWMEIGDLLSLPSSLPPPSSPRIPPAQPKRKPTWWLNTIGWVSSVFAFKFSIGIFLGIANDSVTNPSASSDGQTFFVLGCFALALVFGIVAVVAFELRKKRIKNNKRLAAV